LRIKTESWACTVVKENANTKMVSRFIAINLGKAGYRNSGINEHHNCKADLSGLFRITV
jgi:hypothetical protein